MSRALELASYCDEWPGLVHEEVALELRRLAAEVETLREERTAWRVTAENAEAELTILNEMNDQLREQNTAVDEACAQLEAAVKQARIDALEEAKQHLVKLKEQSLAAQTKDAKPMTFADDVNKNIRLATVLLAGAMMASNP